MQARNAKAARNCAQRLSQLWEWFGEKPTADLSTAEYLLHRHPYSAHTYRAGQPGRKLRELTVAVVRVWRQHGWVVVDNRTMRLTDAGWRALHGIPRRRRKR